MSDIDELTELYLQSLRDGSSVDIRQFAERYPECRDELLEILPVLAAMEDLGHSSRTAARPAQVTFPDQLGEFRLEERLGQGGMGTVFKATQQSLNRSVAVKILAPTWAADDRLREKFDNESRLIACLHHTNIVEVYGAGQDQGYCYYVMEFVDGYGLNDPRWREVDANGNLEETIAKIGLQAANALSYAHRQGILHRDIKPSNLLLDKGGTVHVSDFGLATALSQDAVSTVASQSQDGTLRYMAPERLLSGGGGAAADQYSLGLTLYELLAGRPALSHDSPGKMIKRICEEGVPPLPAKNSDLAVIINKSVSFIPEDRYRSLEAMAADLQRFLRNEPILARSTSWLRRLRLWVRRRPAVAMLTFLTIFLGILLLNAITIGYLEISDALQKVNLERQRAEENIRIADATLARIFKRTLTAAHIDVELPPTRANTRLLHDIMPYFEKIAAEGDAPQAKIAQAKKVLGVIALRSNNLPLAESILAEAALLFPSKSFDAAYCRNQHALAIYRQKRTVEAWKLWQKIAADFESSADYTCRLEAVRALRSAALSSLSATLDNKSWQRPPRRRLHSNSRPAAPAPTEDATATTATDDAAADASIPDAPGTAERAQTLKKAMAILLDIMRDHPDHPECRFMQALLLSDAPNILHDTITIAGQVVEPFEVLDRLTAEFPDNHQYRLELIRCAQKLDLREPAWQENIIKVKRALRHREILLATYPWDSDVVDDVFALQQNYLNALIRKGEYRTSNRVLHQTIGLLRLLVSQPEALPETQERLVRLLFQQVAGTIRHRRTEETEEMLEDLRTLLKAYTGPRATEFQKKLDDLAQLAAAEPKTPIKQP
ncbi:MAG TPA: serine/threonine-protein kinase [Lentisphaeria bacterium]|nr:serine/threonine-protein kinase [Lentisphaeria bacterium]